MPSFEMLWAMMTNPFRGTLLAVALILGIPILQEDPSSDEPVRLSLFPRSYLSVEPFRLFSHSYDDARDSFRTAVEQLQGQNKEASLHSLPVFEENGYQYTMDVAVVKGSLPGLVVHTSGVHGVEGYAGSAIQLAALQLLRQRSPHPTYIFVHAFNPYGMAHFRRVNENNVDLNRNGLQDFAVVDTFVTSKRNYDFFDKLLFNPDKIRWYTSLQFWIKGLIAIVRFGLPALKETMVTGQYHKPTGISYGGSKVEPSLLILRDFLQNHLKNEDATQQAVTWIDVHTGLGKLGVDTLLLKDFETTAAEMEAWFPGVDTPFASADGAAVSQGYANTRGFTGEYYQTLFSRDQQSLFLTQEFGTLPTILVGRALIMENAAYHHLPPSEHLEYAKHTTRDVFYPQSSYWRKNVLERGVRLLQLAADRSVKLSTVVPTKTS